MTPPTPSYPIHGGSIGPDETHLSTMRGNTHFNILLQHKRVQGTVFGDNFLTLLAPYQRNLLRPLKERLTSSPQSRDLYDLIFRHCSSCMEKLAPQTHCQGYTFQDFVHAPTYSLEITRADDDGKDTCVLGGDHCVYRPVLDICPLKMTNYPADVRRLPASYVKVNVDDRPSLGSTQGRAELPDGLVVYLKPRENGRERAFDRELGMLVEIKRVGLVRDEIRLSGLHGIVVTKSEGEEVVVGMLIDLIPTTSTTGDGSLLDPARWGRSEQHEKWERQVRGTVEELHACGLVWGDVNAGNVVIDVVGDAWVIDFGGGNNAEFVDDDKAETVEGDWQGVERLFGGWLPGRRALDT